MRRRSLPVLVTLLLGVACSADPTTAAGALAAPKKPSATAPKATPPPTTATPTTATPVAPSPAAFHKVRAVTPADFEKLAPSSPGAKIDRAQVAPAAAPTEDPAPTDKADADGGEGTSPPPKSGAPQ